MTAEFLVRVHVRPSYYRAVCMVSVYIVPLLIGVLVVDFIIPSQLIGRTGLEMPVTVGTGVLIPLAAAMVWWCTSFEIGLDGLHQDILPLTFSRAISSHVLSNTIRWHDAVRLTTHTPWLIAICWHLPSGGVLTRLRNALKPKPLLILPTFWLLSNPGEVQAALQRYAPPEHPLRKFYRVPEEQPVDAFDTVAS